LYDVLIIGAGPAGAIAAALLVRKGHSVLLLERAALPRPRTPVVWVNGQVAALLEPVGVAPRDAGARPFTEVALHSADLARTARPRFEKPLGFLVNRESLDQAVLRAATEAGAELRTSWPVSGIDLREDHVEVAHEGGERVTGRVLLAAMGSDGKLLAKLCRGGQAPKAGHWAIHVQLEAEAGSAELPAVSVVLGLDRQGSFGQVVADGTHLAISVCGPGQGTEAAALLAELCRSLAKAGMVPRKAVELAAKVKPRLVPAGAALEMDSHVAKHALIVGDAGGFIAATSQEGIYPAMWSAKLAVEVLEQALKSRHSQDTLMKFDAKWRMAMADYLRPPNTDLQFLLPLIFANQPMADRMGAAFFLGQAL